MFEFPDITSVCFSTEKTFQSPPAGKEEDAVTSLNNFFHYYMALFTEKLRYPYYRFVLN